MKNFKKVLALVLAFSMVLSTMTAFAAEAKYSTEAEELHELGLFQGVDKDKFVPNLEGDLTREMAMKLIVDMMGWEADEDATSDFEDVASWAQPYVAVAVEEGITNGKGDGTFGGTDVATMHQLITWYLRALGYDASEAWDNAAALAMEAGLVTASDLMSFDNEVKRDDYVGVGYRALTVTKVGSDATLIEELVEAGRVDEDTAIELGLIEYVPTKFEVVDVNAEYLVKTVIEFSKAVDKDSLKDSSVKIDGKKVDKDDLELSEDGYVLTVKHDAVDNGKEAEVIVDKVKDEDGNKIEDYEVTVKYIDTDPIGILSAEAMGTYEVLVKFTEPVDPTSIDKSDFELKNEDGKTVRIRSVEPVDSTDKTNSEVIVTATSKLEEKEYTLKVKAGLQDYAGIGAFEEVSFDVIIDESAPEIVGYEVKSSTQVVFEFDEPIKFATSESKIKDASENLLYHTNKTNDASNVSIDGKKLTVDFKQGYDMPEGTVYVYFGEEIIKDFWGNENADFRYELQIEKDDEAPIIDEVKQGDSQKEIVIVFEKDDLKESVAKDQDNYVVTDGDNEEVDIQKVRVNGKEVTITLKEEQSGVFYVEVKNIEDKDGNEMEDEVVEVTLEDNVRKSLNDVNVYLYNKGEEDQLLVVDFGFKLGTDGEYAAEDLSKYTLMDTSVTPNKYIDLKDEEDVEIQISENEQAVEISIPLEVVDITNFNNYELEIGRVEDAAGNLTKELSVNKNLVDLSSTDITIKEISAVEKDELEIVFNGQVDFVDVSDFTITVDGQDVEIIEELELKHDADNGETKVRVLIDTDLKYDVSNTIVFKTNTSVETGNNYGQRLAADVTYNKTIADKVAPELVNEKSSFTTPATVDLVFSEAVQAKVSDALMATTFKVTLEDDDSKVLVAAIDYTATVVADANGDNTIVRITLAEDYAGYILIEFAGDAYLVDGNDNELVEFEDLELGE